MLKTKRLSIDEITCLWSKEIGEDPLILKKDIQKWLVNFLDSSGHSLDAEGQTAAIEYSQISVRIDSLFRRTFEVYCEERGFVKPTFWFNSPEEKTPIKFLENLELNKTLKKDSSRCEVIEAQSQKFDNSGDYTSTEIDRQNVGLRKSVRLPSAKNREQFNDTLRSVSMGDQISIHKFKMKNWNSDQKSDFEVHGKKNKKVCFGIALDSALKLVSEGNSNCELRGDNKRNILGRYRIGFVLVFCVFGIMAALVFWRADYGIQFYKTQNSYVAKGDGGLTDRQSSKKDGQFANLSISTESPIDTVSGPVGSDYRMRSIEEKSLAVGNQGKKNIEMWENFARDRVENETKSQNLSIDSKDLRTEKEDKDRELASTAASARVSTLQKELAAAHDTISDMTRALAISRKTIEGASEESGRNSIMVSPVNSVPNPTVDQGSGYREVDQKPSISAEELFTDVEFFLGYQLIVVGHAMRLAGEYWLQSENGSRSIRIEIGSLHQQGQQSFKQEFVTGKFLARIKVRAEGTLLIKSKKYILSVSELRRIE